MVLSRHTAWGRSGALGGRRGRAAPPKLDSFVRNRHLRRLFVQGIWTGGSHDAGGSKWVRASPRAVMGTRGQIPAESQADAISSARFWTISTNVELGASTPQGWDG